MQNLKIENKEKSQISITGELEWDSFKNYRKKAIMKIGEVIEVDGFRKGKIPEDIIVKKAGNHTILEEMASLAFQDIYPTILKENNIDAIGRPSIQITKLAEGNPLGFSITTAVMPKISLPDYKKIAAKVNKNREVSEVSDEDVEKAIEDIKTMKAKQDLFKKMQDGSLPGDDTIENKKDETPEEVQKRIDEKLEIPELNDEFVQSVGGFKTVDEFKKAVRENLVEEKNRRADDKNRIDIIESITKETKLDIPDIVIESELDQLMHRMKSDVAQMGMEFKDYLEKLKKTEEEIRTDARKDAEKRAQIQFIVSAISREEGIDPDKDRVEKEVEKILKQYTDVSEEAARAYIENIIVNDEVFKFLQSQK
jgi:trigger factor